MFENKIIWTRSADDWDTDVHILKPALDTIVHLPCIRTQAVPNPVIPEIPANQPVIVVFASIKAVQYSLANSVITSILRRAQRVFALGAKTASYLQQHRFKVESNLQWSGIADLAKYLLPLLTGEELVLAPGPRIRTMNLAELIEGRGADFIAMDVYETSAGMRGENDELLLQADIDQLQRNLSGVLCFASPSAVMGFVKWLNPDLFGLRERLKVVCIGETTLKQAIEYFDDCTMSDSQSTESMFATARRLMNG